MSPSTTPPTKRDTADPTPPDHDSELPDGGRLGIRPAAPDDVPLVLRFVRELADYERLAHEVTASEEDFHRELFGPGRGAEVVIARLDGEPVGMALFFHNFSTFLARRGLYLEDLLVTPAARNRGIGRELLAYLARLAVARGCGRFEWAVLDWNEPAICFYRALGAEAMDEWTVFRLTGDALSALASPAD